MRELSASSLFSCLYMVGKAVIKMADIVPELNARIEASFDGYVMRDRQLSQISNRIRDGTATLKDAHAYAERLGEDLSRALVTTLTPEALPNETLYYNIAQRTIIPGLENNYKLVNDAAELIQKSIDNKNKIGLGVVRADFPLERINGLIDKITQEVQPVDMVIRWLQEPIINNSEAFADDFVKSNALFRSKAGLKTTITRIADPKCCDWCAALEGKYEYEPGLSYTDVYRRHEFCRCVVTFQSEKRSQNVWSKREWETSEQELERRKSTNNPTGLSVEERLEQIRQLERDKEIAAFQKATGYSREAARASTLRKNPQQIEAQIKKIMEGRKTGR